MDAVQPFDPARGLVKVDAELFSIFLAHLHFGALAIGVVRLIVDHHEVFVRSQLAQHTARESFVTFLALLHHRAFLIFQRHQRVPVLDQQFRLVQARAQCFVRAQVELVVDVLLIAWIERLQAALHRQARRHNEDGAREAAVLGVADRVQRLPGDDHAHQRRLA